MNESTKVTVSLGLTQDEYDLLRNLLIREDNRLERLPDRGHLKDRILAKRKLVGNLFDYLGEAYKEACER